MKICIVNSFYYPEIIGGAELSVMKLAQQLYNEGHDIEILCTGIEDKIENINGINVHRVKMNNIFNHINVINNEKSINKLMLKIYYIIDIYNIFSRKLLLKKLKDIRPDIIHVNNVCGISCVVWDVAKKLKIPIVQTLRDYYLLKLGNRYKDKLKRKIICNLSSRVQLVTAPSKYTLDMFIENEYFNNANTKVIYNAIDFDKSEIEKILKEKKEKLKKKDKIRYVFIGRLEEEKGIKFLINTFKNIVNSNIELLIAGDGSYREYVEGEIKLDSRIKYKGFLDENQINALLKESDILIIPSLWPEPFGRVIIEAYKFSIPVIGTINGGIPEVIKDGVTGKLIESNNKEELQDAIIYFSEKERIYQMMDNCKNELEKYSIEKHANEFLELYNFILN